MNPVIPVRIVAGLVAGLWALCAGAVEPLVSSQWLARQIPESDVLVVDVRMADDGASAYARAHVPGAVFTRYPGDGWLSERDSVRGMLPDLSKLEVLLGNLGVDEDRHVVLVPGQATAADYAAATRVYWTLKVLGHERVSVLDGGLPGWVAAGLAVEAGVVEPEPSFFEPSPREDLSADLARVSEVVSGAREVRLLDTREGEQFAGKSLHPWVSRGGALPGALSLDPRRFVDAASGRLASLQSLSALIPTAGGTPIVTYCNTGHFASLSWFVARELLGQEDVRLYDGSMVEWSADARRPLVPGWSQARLDTGRSATPLR